MILGVSGKAGSGKDESCKYLQIKYKFKILRFSKKIKEIVSMITKTSLKSNYCNKSLIVKSIPCSPKELALIIKKYLYIIYTKSKANNYDVDEISRKLVSYKNKSLAELQVIIGEGFRLLFTKRIWIDFLAEEIRLNKGSNMCVVDLRFKTEANWIKMNIGAKLLRLEREYELRKVYLCGRNPDDPCETDLDEWKKFDFVVQNNKKKEDLFKELDKIVSLLKLKNNDK